MIYVFDGDEATNVVCEGYAKAFQYLCDLDGITYYSVSGTMNGGTGTLTVSAAGGDYNGTPYTATVTGTGVLENEAPEITYCCDGGCINAGDHTASITFGRKTASVTFTISKAIPAELTAPTATAITYGNKLSASNLSDGWKWVDGTTIPNSITNHNAYIVVDDSNYDYTGVDGYDSANHRVVRGVEVQLNKAALTVTAKSYPIKVGTALPTYDYTVAGLVGNDTLPVSVAISCNAADSNTVGIYDITVSGEAATSLYAITYVNGKLIVTDKEIQEITADDVTMTYGEAKNIGASTSGDGEITYTVATGADVISVAADGTITALKAGTATVTINAAETDTYATAEATATVTVNKKQVTITADNITIYVGDDVPDWSVTIRSRYFHLFYRRQVNQTLISGHFYTDNRIIVVILYLQQLIFVVYCVRYNRKGIWNMETVFSVQLQKLRKEKGITQDVLASHLGVSPQAVSKWENGSYPDGDLLPKIADFFGVSIDYLYGRATKEISLEQRILDHLQSIEFKKKDDTEIHDEYFEQMMKILWSMQVASWRSQHVYYDRTVIDDEKNGYTVSQSSYNCGASFMTLNQSLEYYMLIKEPENGFAKYFSDEQKISDMTKLCRFFGDKDNFKVTLFMMSLKWDESVKPQTVAVQLNIPLEKVEKALEFLTNSVLKDTFLKAHIINELNNSETIYRADNTRIVIPMMALVAVDGMLKSPENYSMQTGMRQNGGAWIDRNDLAFIKNGKKE